MVLRCGGFDEGDFGVGEAVELIDELVNLPVGGFDLALEDGVGVRRPAALTVVATGECYV